MLADRKVQIEQFIETIDASIIEDPDDECAIIPDHGPAVICTHSAKLIANRFNGKVMGFSCEDNPGTSLEEFGDGHDFAVIDDRYIADFWIKYVEGISQKTVFDMNDSADANEIKKIYGDSKNWEEVR